MKVLLLGASGFLGRHVFNKLSKSTYCKEVVGTSFSKNTDEFIQLDVTDNSEFETFYKKQNPDVIVWTLMSADNEYKLIHEGLKNLLRVIDKNTKLIYVSTDGVFSTGEGNFDESDEPSYLDTTNPLASYTNAKLDGELMIQRQHQNHAILRTGPLYGQAASGRWDGRVLALKSALQKEVIYERADNIYKTFVYVEDMRDAIVEIAISDFAGLLHVGPTNKESYYSFSLKIAKYLNLNTDYLKPVPLPKAEAKEKGISLDTSLNTKKSHLLIGTVFKGI